jgi:hypothetical protein
MSQIEAQLFVIFALAGLVVVVGIIIKFLTFLLL